MQEGGGQQWKRGNYNVHGEVHFNGRYNSGQHCYRNHAHYNTEGNNKAKGIIMYMIPHYNAGGGRQQQKRGNYNVHGKMHYNGRYNSGQHAHYNTEGNKKAGGIIMCTIPIL